VTFNEKVTGATTNSFAFRKGSGAVTGNISKVTAVGSAEQPMMLQFLPYPAMEIFTLI
jgi:hypothetical protein